MSFDPSNMLLLTHGTESIAWLGLISKVKLIGKNAIDSTHFTTNANAMHTFLFGCDEIRRWSAKWEVKIFDMFRIKILGAMKKIDALQP